MSDFEAPKEFPFGDLNPVQKRRTSPSADPGSISVLDALKEVVISHYTPDATSGTGPYKGIVLRVEDDLDQNNPAPGNWLATVFGPQGMFASLNPFSAPKSLKRLKVRIPEIHTTLPVPQKYAQDINEQGDHQKIINMYPTFVAHDSNVESAEPGDLVWVDYGNKENFEDPTYIGPVFPPPETSGAGGAGGGGASGSAAFGNCGGGAGLSGASGGSIKPSSIPITEENAKWKNGMYLSSTETKKRNNQDPMKPKVLMAGYSFNETKKYVSAGGSGRAVSGKVGLGCVADMSNVLSKYMTALRIAVEDQADRGYAFGGKPVDPTKGGIDCSGFVCAVRNMMEFMIYPDVDQEKVNGYRLTPTVESKHTTAKQTKKNWRSFSLLVRPTYGTGEGGKPKPDCVKHEDGWDWVEPMALKRAGQSVSDSANYINYLDRVIDGDFGSDTAKPVYYTADSGFHFMPGDEVTHTPPKPPSWAKSKLGISHIMTVFADPDGNLRLSESGGPHGGTGSRPLQEYIDRALETNHKIWVWQRPEWSYVWSTVEGGRPDQPWTPELCRQLAGDEYFGAPKLANEATQDAATTEVKSEDGTTTEKAADAAGPKIEPEITEQNITRSLALTATESQAEKDEIMALPQDSSAAQYAETAGGKRAIAKSLEEAKIKQSTPATESTAAQNTTPSASPAPVPVATCGGGSYTPGQPFVLGADRAGTPIGDVPFIGELGEVRTNPKMKVVKTKFDRWGPKNYYGDPRMREDVAVNLAEIKRITAELGCLMASSGATRELHVYVKPTASAKSFHYTGLAVDILLPGMMNKVDSDLYVVEFDPENQKRFIVWVRSSKTSGTVEKKGVSFSVEHKTLNAIKETSSGPKIIQTTGYFVNLTKLFLAHGMEGIGPVRDTWYQNCSGASEAWHFDFRKNAGLVTGSTTFGMTLETMHDVGKTGHHPPWRHAGAVWRNTYFKD